MTAFRAAYLRAGNYGGDTMARGCDVPHRDIDAAWSISTVLS